MSLLRRLQRLIDRSWIKSGYLGKPTLLHIVICAIPVLSLGAVAGLAEPYSRTASLILVLAGIAACIGFHCVPARGFGRRPDMLLIDLIPEEWPDLA